MDSLFFIMTEVQSRLEALDTALKDQIAEQFGSVTYFYETVYLVVQNAHVLQQQAPQGFEKKLEVIEYYKSLIEKKLDSFGLDGKEWVADIASDYFEDYVHYREPQLTIPDDVFYGNLKKFP